jgi:hypothetical protein
MNELGGFSVKTFTDRLFLQKSIYLFQALGIDLRFRFALYDYGPYSDHLTLIACDIDNDVELQDKADRLTIKEEVKSKIDVLKQMLAEKPYDLNNYHWFEFLSSIHYVKHISLDGRGKKREIKDVLCKQQGKRFRFIFDKIRFQDHFEKAWNIINYIEKQH